MLGRAAIRTATNALLQTSRAAATATAGLSSACRCHQRTPPCPSQVHEQWTPRTLAFAGQAVQARQAHSWAGAWATTATEEGSGDNGWVRSSVVPPGRGVVELRGPDSATLLQGIVTADLGPWLPNAPTAPGEAVHGSGTAAQHAVYTFFLTPQGRILHEGCIFRGNQDGDDSVYYIECDADFATTLVKHLRMYALRKKVKIADCSANMAVLATLAPPGTLPPTRVTTTGAAAVAGGPDPRLDASVAMVTDTTLALHRFVLDQGPDTLGDDGGVKETVRQYVAARVRLGLAEGAVDVPPKAAFPLECNADLLNAVSFTKGCYLGQELTARTHHTGVTRKRLVPITLTRPDGAPLTAREVDVDAGIVTADGRRKVGRVRTVVDGDAAEGEVVHALTLLRLAPLATATPLEGVDRDGHVLVATPGPPLWMDIAEVAPKDDAP
eukprot:m.25470 g.25470  ORF g.25470 m.25470 type:complete len:440 (+) comp4240_c0_seq1:81-1400(+)